MRGAIYSRVSTEIQDYGKQTDELKDYAARNNIEVKYIFEEKVSGFKDDRTEFKKLEKLTKNDIDIILVWELSRLSRRSIFIQQTVKNFANKGICIFTKKEGLYTLNDDGTENKNAMFTIGVISMIAEQEIETLKERTISSKRRYILKEGHSYTPIAPYGYNYNSITKQLTINEDEAKVVRRMYQLSIDGVSTNRISKILTSEGIKTKKGNPNWSLATVRDILHNPVYKGVPKYTMTIRNKKVVELVSAPPIVSEEVFEQSEKEVEDLHQRTREGMETARLNGKQIGMVKGTKLVTKRNVVALFLAFAISATGYYIAEGIMFGFTASFLTSVSGSIVQSGGSAIMFVIIGTALDKIGFKTNIAK